MRATLSYSLIGYLNCPLSCSCIIYPDLGLPTQVERAEHLPIAKLFHLEGAEIFFKILVASIVKTIV